MQLDPLHREINGVTRGEKADIYPLLARFDQIVSDAFAEGGRDPFIKLMRRHHGTVIDLVDAAATDDAISWDFLRDCVNAYPPGPDDDHHCSGILAAVTARCVIRTRVRDGVEELPAWPLKYLGEITFDADGDWAGRPSAAFGWGIGHPSVAVADHTIHRAETVGESWAIGVLECATAADPAAGIALFEQLLASPEVEEDLWFLSAIERVSMGRLTIPAGWDPTEELGIEPALSDATVDATLAALGRHVHPRRLRAFDKESPFDLERAAAEFGEQASE